MPQIATRLNQFTESVIREMSRVAAQYRAVNLAQGFPDNQPPAELITAAQRALAEGHNQYTITWGALRFRQALAAKQSRFMGFPIDPEDIIVTCGGTEAIMVAMMTVCNPGDKVVTFSPFYENYAADSILCGTTPIYVSLSLPDFTFDPAELRQAMQQGVKALIVCNPANPSGKVFGRDELQIIADLAQEFDAFVITDEVYEHIVFPPYRHTYLASLPGMFERTLSCSSLSKTYSITGWRLGYVIAPPQVVGGARKVHDFLTIVAATPLQEAAVTALQFPDSYYAELTARYAHRRDILFGYLDQAELRYYRPQGAYYVLVDVSEFGFATDLDVAIWLAKEVGVAGVPGSSFFRQPGQQLIRFNFAKQEKTLHAAGERLLQWRQKL